MKGLVAFINERLTKSDKEYIKEQFLDYLSNVYKYEKWKSLAEVKDWVYDNIADFCDDCDITDDEMDELIDRGNKYNNNNFMGWTREWAEQHNIK